MGTLIFEADMAMRKSHASPSALVGRGERWPVLPSVGRRFPQGGGCKIRTGVLFMGPPTPASGRNCTSIGSGDPFLVQIRVGNGVDVNKLMVVIAASAHQAQQPPLAHNERPR
jgi:hypothetical protein